MRGILVTLIGGLLAVWQSAPQAAERAVTWLDTGTPLKVRNLSPATQIYGLPVALGPVPPRGHHDLALVVEHSNNFTARAAGDTVVEFDGSTTVSSFVWQQTLGERFEWGAALPFVHHGGGFTDGFIEGYHDLFGFPDGDRDLVPRNRLRYRVEHEGGSELLLEDATSDFGDLRAWLGYRLHDSSARQMALRAMVKAPTGELSELSGSGATDASLWLELTDRQSLDALNLTVTLMGGITRLGEGDLAPAAQETWVATGHVGLHLPLTRRLTLRAQIDGHGDVIDSDVDQLGGAALQGTLGGSLALSAGTWVDVGVSEDLSSESAPDVVFLLTVGSRL